MAIINLQFEDQATKSLDRVAKKHLPFVIAKSLTKTSQSSQEKVRKHIKEEFHIRKKAGGFESSIHIKPATKKNLTTEIFSMAAFASLQQTGGTKKARNGNRLAIPVYENIRDVQRKTNKNSPSGYLAGNAFMIKLKNGQEAIAQRHRKRDLRILYFLKKNANVEKRLNMIEVAKRTVNKDFAMLFNKTLRDVIIKS